MNTPPSPSKSFVNYLLLLGIALIWGSQYFFIKVALTTFSNGVVMGGRVSIGACVLTFLTMMIVGKSSAPPTSRSFFSFLPEFILIGFFDAALPCFLIAWAQRQVPISVTAILIGTVPLFATILEALFVKDYPFSRKKMVAILVGFLGVLVLIGPSFLMSESKNSFTSIFPLLPVTALLGSSLCFAISVSLIKIRLSDKIVSLRAAQGILIGATISALPFLFFFSKPWIIGPLTQASFGALILLGIFAGGVVYTFYVTLVGRAGPSFTSSANYLALPIGTFMGIVFAQEPLTPNVIVSFALILSALWLLREK